jgi:hypothetical protein
MPSCGTALSPCRRAARRQGPGAALPVLAHEIDCCRRATHAGGRDLTPWDVAVGA